MFEDWISVKIREEKSEKDKKESEKLFYSFLRLSKGMVFARDVVRNNLTSVRVNNRLHLIRDRIDKEVILVYKNNPFSKSKVEFTNLGADENNPLYKTAARYLTRYISRQKESDRLAKKSDSELLWLVQFGNHNTPVTDSALSVIDESKFYETLAKSVLEIGISYLTEENVGKKGSSTRVYKDEEGSLILEKDVSSNYNTKLQIIRKKDGKEYVNLKTDDTSDWFHGEKEVYTQWPICEKIFETDLMNSFKKKEQIQNDEETRKIEKDIFNSFVTQERKKEEKNDLNAESDVESIETLTRDARIALDEER